MPTLAKSHEECRQSVCLLCFSKTKIMKKITDTMHSIIKEHVVSGLDFDDIRLPSVICGNCYTILYEYNKGNFSHRIELFNFANIEGCPIHSSTERKCYCTVCETARASTTLNFGLSKTVIQKRKPGSSTSSGKNSYPGVLKLCSKCLTALSRGKPHNCLASQRNENLLHLASSGPSPQSEQKLASSILREK